MLGYTSGSSFKALMDGGFLGIYGGTRPANPETVEGSTALVIITKDSVAFDASHDLNFEDAAAVGDGVVSKLSTEIWSGVVAAGGGTATWFRFYASDDAVGASTTKKRFDGSCGSAGTEDLVLANSALVAAATLTIDTFNVGLPIGTYA